MNSIQKSKCRELLEIMEVADLLSIARANTKLFIQLNWSKGKLMEEAIDAILTTIKTPEEIFQWKIIQKKYLVLYLQKNQIRVSTKYTLAELRSRILELWRRAANDLVTPTCWPSDTGATSSKKTSVKRKDVNPSPTKSEKKTKVVTNDSDFKEKSSTIQSEKREYLVSVAFDFGTTFSGYAFSFRGSQNNIIINQNWVPGCDTLISLKTPSCVLLDPRKEFVDFGYEAENKYSELVEDGLHKGYYFFQRFKMALYNKEITKDILVEDISGKKLPALLVFSLAIKYLYNHFWKALETKGSTMLKSDVQYVLTVPAIWSDKAKQFMRKACTEAGIQSEQLRMALEPEAASVWCQADYEDSLLSATGSKYMVVDLGGGTADITVNETMPDGTLRELHKASGGPWGGIVVDKAYIKFLSKIFGEDIINEFQKNQIGDYFNLLRNFETKKRSINSSSGDKMTFWIPLSLIQLFESRGISLGKKLNSPQFQGISSPSGDKLRIDKIIANGFFDEVLHDVTSYVRSILEMPSLGDVQCILLVGGFADCSIVQDAFRYALGCKRLIVPADAGLFVLKGAVILGHKPELISERRSKFNYGTCVYERFNDAIHQQDKKIKESGEEWCKDVFGKVVSIGDILHRNREFTKEGNVIDVSQKTVVISLYCSDKDEPMYVTDAGCTFLGELKIDLPQTNTIEDKAFTISLIFWDTEIRVKVEILKTKKKFETSLNSI